MKYDCQKVYSILIKMENFPKDKGEGIKGPNSLFNEKLFDFRLGHLKIWYYTCTRCNTNVPDDNFPKNCKGLFRT